MFVKFTRRKQIALWSPTGAQWVGIWVATMVRGSRGETQGLSCWNDEPIWKCQMCRVFQKKQCPPPAQPPEPKWSEHVQVVSSWFFEGMVTRGHWDLEASKPSTSTIINQRFHEAILWWSYNESPQRCSKNCSAWRGIWSIRISQFITWARKKTLVGWVI